MKDVKIAHAIDDDSCMCCTVGIMIRLASPYNNVKSYDMCLFDMIKWSVNTIDTIVSFLYCTVTFRDTIVILRIVVYNIFRPWYKYS